MREKKQTPCPLRIFFIEEDVRLANTNNLRIADKRPFPAALALSRFMFERIYAGGSRHAINIYPGKDKRSTWSAHMLYECSRYHHERKIITDQSYQPDEMVNAHPSQWCEYALSKSLLQFEESRSNRHEMMRFFTPKKTIDELFIIPPHTLNAFLSSLSLVVDEKDLIDEWGNKALEINYNGHDLTVISKSQPMLIERSVITQLSDQFKKHKQKSTN